MIYAITNFIIKQFGVDASKARRYAVITLAVGAFLILILIAGGIQSCNGNRTEKKIEQTRENITTGKVESNVQANIVNRAANNSNAALENVNAVKRADSNKYSNDFDETLIRFCERFPNDSLCKK